MKKQKIEATRKFGASVSFGKTAGDYRTYRAGFPQEFFEALQARGWAFSSGRALDLGTGTGTVARGLAGLGMQVDATDPSEALVSEARALDREAGVSVHYSVGKAEVLGETDKAYDLVTAGQCWHWFDRTQAAQEVARVLKPGGRIVIAHFDWLPLPGNVVEATEDLILRYNPNWTMAGGAGVYPDWFADLSGAGLEEIESFSFDHLQAYSPEAWRGRIRASAGVQASLSPDEVSSFDVELQNILAKHFPGDVLSIPHRVWAVSGTAKVG